MRVSFFYLLLFALGLLCPGTALAGAETTVEAGLGLGGEYNDNVNETATSKKAEFITHIKPVFKFNRTGGGNSFSVDYRGDYQFYGQGSKGDDYMHYLKAAFTGEVVENLFFLDITQDLQPVYSDAARGDIIEGDSTLNMVNKNKFTVSPYFRLQFSPRTDAKFGYRFSDIRYSQGNNRSHPLPGLNSEYDLNSKVSQQHTAFTEINHELTDTVQLKSGLDATRIDVEKTETSSTNPSLTRYKAYLGGTWELSEDLTANMLVGPSYTMPDEGKGDLKPYVNSSLRWGVGRSEFGLAYDMDYYDDPETGGSKSRTSYSSWWTKNFDRTHLTVKLEYRSYDTAKGGTEENFRPSLSSSYDLSERLSATASVLAEISSGNTKKGNTYYTNLGLHYQLAESSQISLTYRNKSAEKSAAKDGFDVNRLMLETSIAF